ncbi:unnamed protein product [Lathyrus sativus]|nr:unnamed protein product [Lathyrus sativus]
MLHSFPKIVGFVCLKFQYQNQSTRRDSDSNSNRRDSRFHPEPSPKRYRKYVKQDRMRTKSSSNVENQGHRRHNPADPTQPGPSSW